MSVYGAWRLSDYKFADVIFHNIVELKTDLYNDVSWVLKRGDSNIFADFVAFFNIYGGRVLNTLPSDGFVVIGRDALGFYLLTSDEYEIHTERGVDVISSKSGVPVYVLRSETQKTYNKSDLQMLHGWLVYLDNILNASNTLTERFGTMTIAMPEQMAGSLMPVTLEETERKEVEVELSRDYGALARQSQILLLSRGMKFQTINMAGLDIKLQEKVRLAILAICDRLKVPANQVAIIDANNNKSLSNGSELREGDFSKYQSFERLLNSTFVEFARDLGLSVDYMIYNKPLRDDGNNK